MRSTREKILRRLLAFPGSTINDLADTVGINGISIRHHLTALEAEDLVSSSEERHGVGRPHLTYTLTDKGVELFPTSYLRLTRRLLTELKEKLSSEELKSLFQDIGEEIAKGYEPELHNKSIGERLDLLKSILTREGFIVEWQRSGMSYTLTSLSCPYYKIGMDYPEICSLDHALISKFFSGSVEIETCILRGEDHCVYQIPLQQEEGTNE